MKLGANLLARDAAGVVALAQSAEALGFDSLWRGEAYGGDAVVPLTWAAARTTRIRLGTAILQMPARTPAMTAMTAISLDQLSDGRAVLGLGMSGPQVVEGWHGLPYQSPLRTTEEYVEIVRMIMRGDERVVFEGTRFQLPYRGPGATGVGKAMRPGLHTRADIPIHLAAIGPRNVALAARIADGLLPMLWNPHRAKEAIGDALAHAGPSFELAPTVPVVVGDDVAACRDEVRPLIAMYVGGMGAKGRNFYNDLVRRYGFEETAGAIQDAYLDGRRRDAVALVPDRLVDELALVGPTARIAEHLEPWATSGVTTLILAAPTPLSMRVMAELVL